MEKYYNNPNSVLKSSLRYFAKAHLKRLVLLCTMLLGCWAASAQGFPVQLIPQITPPPPIYLSEYADASVTNGPLRVQLLLNDFSISSREVRLRMYFEGNGLSFQSNPIVNGAAPLFLEGGVPLVLTQTDLAPYFQFENISGVSGNAYGKVLAEGSYSVCYEVIDVLTGNRLSARTCAAAIVFQNEPPLLVMPYNRGHVEEKNPQNIVFQWTPRHLNVTNVEYQLDIVEVWDNQVDPQQAFLSSPPVFSITTNNTNYVYGPADPLLLSGKRYAWRVTAKALQGTEEIGLFKNQGHSEIYSFSYAGECGLPEGVTYEVKGKSNVNLYWTDLSTEVPEYTIRYRKKEGENNEWFYSKTTSNTTTLWDLTAGTTYEYQIAKSCGIVVSDFTPVDEFTSATENEEDSLYECGIDPNFSVENTNPLASLSPGDSFVAGDFPVTVETASGSNGRFTGTGFVRIPYLRNLKVAVEFTNVLVNTDSQLAEGSVRTVYDYENSSILDIDEVIDTVDTLAEQVGEFFEGDNDLDEITVNFPIPDTTAIKVQDGNVVITNPANGATVTEPLGDDMVVTDSEGNVYHVDAAGKVTKGGIKDPGGIVNADNVSGVNSRGEIESLTAPGIKVTFNTKGTFGMDLMPSGANAALQEEYTIIQDYEGQDYVLTHHAVKKGADTQILASIAVTGNDYTAEDLIFKTKQGETVTKDVVDGETYLKLNGHYTLESETIYAVVTSKQDSTKQLTAGAFTLWHLTERSVDVALVAVNNAPLDNYQETIDQIFDQGVAQVNFASPLQISITAEELGGSLDVGDSPFAAAYNAEQKMLINKVKNLPDYSRDTYYILVFNDIPASTGIAGFMPLQRQFGFVFSGSGEEEGKGGDKGKVLAHEMGHGIFALQHPFAAYGSDMENATDWLMDYNSGTGLPHMHWAQIHNPDLRFYTFQDEEDGELAGKIWFTPDWDPIKIEGTNSIYTGHLGADPSSYNNLPNGTLPGFRKGGKSYEAVFNEGKFIGYFNGGINGSMYPMEEIVQTGVSSDQTVYLYQYGGCGGSKYYSEKFWYVNLNKNSIDYSQLTFEANIACSQINSSPEENPFNFSPSFCDVLEVKETVEQSWIDSAIKKLNASYNKRNQLYSNIRDKERFYHLVNHGNTFDDRANILEDKLFLLKDKTDINFYVVFQAVTHKLTTNNLDEMARQILSLSELPKDENNVVIVVPFITATSGLLEVTKCMQAGFAQSNQNIVSTSYQNFKIEEDLFSYVLGAYTGIEKPATITYSYLLANREVSIIEKSANRNVRGLPFINSLGVYRSLKYNVLRNKESEGRQIKNTKPDRDDYEEVSSFITDKYEYEEKIARWAVEYNVLVEESIVHDKMALEDANSGDKSPPLEYFEVVSENKGVNLRELYLDPNEYMDLMVNYTTLHQAQDEHFGIVVNFVYTFGDTFEEVENKHLYTEIDTHQFVYNILDVTSLVLSPIGADVIPDAIGLVYSISNGHKTEAGLYAVSISAVGITQWGVAWVKNSKNYTLVAKYLDNGKLAGYEIKHADEVINSINEKPMFSSLSDNLNEARNDFEDALDIDFKNNNSVTLDEIIDTEINVSSDLANTIEELTTSFKSITGITDATANSLAAKNKAADILNLLEAKASVNGFPVQKLADDLANGTDDFIDAMLDADDTFFRVWKQVVDKNVSSNISTNKAFIDKLKSLCN